MNEIKLDGFMYSYIDYKGQERLLTSAFGTTKSKAKRYFNTQNNIPKVQPVKAHKLYSVTISTVEEIKSFDKTQEINDEQF
jgi:hypothetical protein